MKRAALILGMAVLVLSQAGCLKLLSGLLTKKKAMDAYMAYGPIENYGARCDHTVSDLPYAEVPTRSERNRLSLDVYWNDHEGLAPIVVNIHGGGWELGDKKDPNSVFRSKYLAAHGYVVASVNYRLLPGTPVQEQIEDVMGAVIWMKEHAADFGGDPDRVGVMGGSAGGHLAAMVGWASDDDYFVPTGHADSSFDSDVLAAVPFYGVFDLEKTITLENEYLAPLAHAYFTKELSPTERAALFQHISPINHVDAAAVPTLFICGDQDEFGLYPETKKMVRAFRKLDLPTGLITAHGSKHGFDSEHGTKNAMRAVKAMVGWFDIFLKATEPSETPEEEETEIVSPADEE